MADPMLVLKKGQNTMTQSVTDRNAEVESKETKYNEDTRQNSQSMNFKILLFPKYDKKNY